MNRKCVSLFLPGLLLLTVGCGSKGTITGNVSYKGTPITAGTILFVPENGAPQVSAPITEGKYTAEKVPPGPAKVAITSDYTGPMALTPMQRAMQGGMGKGPAGEIPEGPKKLLEGAAQAKEKKGVKIPEKYASPSTADLTYTVKGGSQEHNIDLP